MRTVLLGLLTLLTAVCAPASARAQNPCAPGVPREASPVASETFDLARAAEVGLEVKVWVRDQSWAREGAEALALTIIVDGVYNQDLLLWAGDEPFPYRVALGRLRRGRHTVSAVVNRARSAPRINTVAQAVGPLKVLVFPVSRADEEEQLALAYSPVLYARPNTFDHFTDVPLLMYYEVLREGADTVIRYTAVFSNEDGGTQTAALFARWGRGTDIEWVYEVRLRGGKVVAETFQGVRHETKPFNGQRTGGSHPLLAVASDNNNFSDLACSAVRFAPLPFRARLEAATRESVMDLYPQTYRAMAEELRREGRVSDSPSDINTVADPREYLYVEAASEQAGAAVAFDVKLKGSDLLFKSDMDEPRLRIERSGYYRTAVRLPKGFTSDSVESINARCHPHPASASGGTCDRLKLLRALTLGPDYVPRPLPLQTHPEASLAAGETRTFRLAQSNQ